MKADSVSFKTISFSTGVTQPHVTGEQKRMRVPAAANLGQGHEQFAHVTVKKKKTIFIVFEVPWLSKYSFATTVFRFFLFITVLEQLARGIFLK